LAIPRFDVLAFALPGEAEQVVEAVFEQGLPTGEGEVAYSHAGQFLDNGFPFADGEFRTPAKAVVFGLPGTGAEPTAVIAAIR
jgi:hypothetical protein